MESKEHMLTAKEATAAHIENLLDDALRATFPASDPVAITVEPPVRDTNTRTNEKQ
jgi:hypothetical protein